MCASQTTIGGHSRTVGMETTTIEETIGGTEAETIVRKGRMRDSIAMEMVTTGLVTTSSQAS